MSFSPRAWVPEPVVEAIGDSRQGPSVQFLDTEDFAQSFEPISQPSKGHVLVNGDWIESSEPISEVTGGNLQGLEDRRLGFRTLVPVLHRQIFALRTQGRCLRRHGPMSFLDCVVGSDPRREPSAIMCCPISGRARTADSREEPDSVTRP